MSAKTTTYTEKVERTARVLVCDNAHCDKESKPHDPRTHAVPPGWIAVSESVSSDPTVAGKVRHYCSSPCLTDAVSL